MALPPPYWIGAYFNYGPDESSQVFDLARNIRSAIGRHRQIAIGPNGMLPGRRVWKLANGVQIETTLIAKGLTEDWAVRVFVPPSTATTIEPCYAYMESGLAVFEFPYTGAAEIRFTTAISAFIAARGDAFSLVGRLAVLASDVYTYPPLAYLAGEDFSQGDSANITQESYLTSIVIASEWSGRNMKQWIQAKLGSGVSSQRGSWLASATIGGAFVQNTAVQSHWIYEHRDDSRLEYWAIEANSEGPVRVGLMRLTCASQALALYLQAYSGMSTTDAAWIRGWILQGASWPTEWETIYDQLPSVGGLGYGWHVSDSGARASIHSYTLYNITDGGILHHRSKWYRHDMLLSMNYDSAGIAEWNCLISMTDVGTLETGHYNGITIWGIGADETPSVFITDSSPTAPDPLPSNAEVWGWYQGETWRGVSAVDSGTKGFFDCAYNGPYPDCYSGWSNRICYSGTCAEGAGNCGYSRVFSIDGESGHIGTGHYTINYGYSWDGSGSSGTYGCPSYTASFCPDNWNYSECAGGTWIEGPYSYCEERVELELGKENYFNAGGPIVGDGLALVIPIGIADAHFLVKYTSDIEAITGHVSNSAISGLSVPLPLARSIEIWRYCNVDGVSTLQLYASNENPTPHPLSGVVYNANYVSISETVSAQHMTVTLKTANGNLVVYSDSGGTPTAYPSQLSVAQKYSYSGTVSYGGWLPYLDTGILVPVPSPVYSRQSAVEGIIESCTGPGCGARVATDDSTGITTSNIAMWVGNA